MNKGLFVLLLIGLCSFYNAELKAQDFIYEPKNPSFGGNTFNYQWMLTSAQSQNTIKGPQEDEFDFGQDEDPLASFAQNLNRAILGELSRRLIASQFGDEGIQVGQFVLGNFQIDVTPSGDGLSVVIVDQATGNRTTVVIPNF